jgi:hypothetical protein
LERQLDNNEYDDSQVVSIKVPATHLAYYSSSVQYERVDGKIEVGSTHYKFVKRRLFNDTLELICIPDYKVIRPEKSHPDSHPALPQNFSIDYYTVGDLFKLNDQVPSSSKGSDSYMACLTSVFLLTAGHPPQLIS